MKVRNILILMCNSLKNKHASLESSFQVREYVKGQRKVENKANNPTG